MNKSFGYNTDTHSFRIARHQVGDFGLHISLIRSISWGNNYFPVESPFFPGKPIPYHFYFDFIVGLLEKIGIRIDLAFNVLSALFFSYLLYLIYKIPKILFKEGRAIGLLSVVLFIFHSSLTFVDFLKNKQFSPALVKELWFLPDYLHKGPFDGSVISIFFTMNVFLNQRHLIAGLAISFTILYFVIQKLINDAKISVKYVVLIGIILGFSSRFHTLVFFCSVVSISFLFIFFKRVKFLPPFIISAFLLFIPHLITVVNQQQHKIFYVGFLANQPATFQSVIYFWFMNLGIALFVIPVGILLANHKQKLVFFSFLPLFIIGNLFQLSFKIEHNHSLFHYFFIVANFYASYILVRFWKQKLPGKVLVIILLFTLTMSGIINLFVVKNDYQYLVSDSPENKFIFWIKNNTKKNDIFLSRKEILDPITFAGRKNYLGHIFDMGNNTASREEIVKKLFEAKKKEELVMAKNENIKYIVIPRKNIIDFNYTIDREFFRKELIVAYEDNEITVFKF